MRLEKNLLALTVAVIAVLALEASGAFIGINGWVNSKLPLIDTPMMNFLTGLGGDVFLALFTASALLTEWKKNGRVSRGTLLFILAVVLGLAAVGTLKFIFAEPRPRSYGSGIGGYAFPSGHAFRAAIIASYGSDRWRRYAHLFWAYAVGIALTRLLLHVHWFSDVLFSLLFAPWLYLLLKSLLGGKFQ
ncbi:phosphatase PAP2 family protein [Thermococcus thioreducens]|uniref:PAP2 superfamily protein n=1 Tax=Thermococcus thioreducens TaxID=277988 RepID=A0A0Q2XMD3_9EURY|nr:phosphatase PAP2 family protein [Thermococcus thioreducens]ASJ12617.1 phosphatidylglycerophosphatase [Thermococcus thioreducens]KQH82388.1 phosphatidylglycerophosphatase [Thermococcus thioreducens]SEV87821.1 PAP2 superfamily protein [Thermococcus thioreducens]